MGEWIGAAESTDMAGNIGAAVEVDSIFGGSEDWNMGGAGFGGGGKGAVDEICIGQGWALADMIAFCSGRGAALWSEERRKKRQHHSLKI